MATEFYKGRIPLIYRSLNEGFIRGTPDEMPAFGCVERDFSVDPVEMRDSPSEMKLYDESEYDAIYDAQEEAQDSLEHMYLPGGIDGPPAFEFLDQSKFPDCHTADTEVLTSRGFVAWPDYNWSDPLGTVNPLTHALEYQVPFQKHVREYDGPVVYSGNSRVDFAVTPNHQMYVRKWNEAKRTLSDTYSFVRADELGWYSGMLHAPSGHLGTEIVEVEIPGDRRYDGDDFFALMALVTSDGFAGGTDKTRNLVSFCYFREENRGAVAALAARLGFKEAPSRPGVWNRWSAGALAEWIRANCYTDPNLKAKHKRVPDIVKCGSMRQIKHFLHYFGDRNRSATSYYSSSRQMADDLQELHLKIGMRSAVRPNHSDSHEWKGKTFIASDGFRLSVHTSNKLSLEGKKSVGKDRYKGEVYCAAVPNHTLVTRRNGTILISSNCWAHSTAHCLMFDRLKKNLPVLRFNAVAVATMLGRTNGGWAGLSMKFARDNGYPVIGSGPGEWPQWTRDRRYDTPELREAMKRHRADQIWYDLGKQEYNQTMTRRQLDTLGFDITPVAADHNRAGHSMCQIRRVRIEKGHWGDLTLNTWQGFGHHGLCVLVGWTADNAVGLKSSTPSMN